MPGLIGIDDREYECRKSENHKKKKRAEVESYSRRF
jgi:hypothetical protein